MFGYLISRSYKEALEFDKENNDTKWADAIRDEIDGIKEQEVFTKCQRAKWDANHKKILNAPPPPSSKDQGKLDFGGEV